MTTTNVHDLIRILDNASARWKGKHISDGSLPIAELAVELLKRCEEGYLGDFFRTDYTVEGSDEFPYDMLRYTNSFPADEQASFLMRAEHTGKRHVKLSKYHRDPIPALAPYRWLSKFRWQVVGESETMPL